MIVAERHSHETSFPSCQLSQIVITVPEDIAAYDLTEIYTNYYDIFVKHAFGNYRDILAE
jgi:hypothetical protein